MGGVLVCFPLFRASGGVSKCARAHEFYPVRPIINWTETLGLKTQ